MCNSFAIATFISGTGWACDKQAPMHLDEFHKAITSPRLSQIARHWAVVAPSRIPPWEAITPAAIGPCLGIIWAFTYDATGDEFVGRLAGENVTRVLGRSLKGVRVSEHHNDIAVPSLFKRAKRVVTEPALYRGHGLMFDLGDTVSIGERIMMPLSSDGERCDGVLGATDSAPVPRFTVENTDAAQETEAWFSLR